MGAALRFPTTWGPDVLRRARERVGLTRAALARASGVSESTIAKLERGMHAATIRIAVRLCRVLHLPSPDPGPALSIPLGGCDLSTAARIVRQALQEFAADRHDAARFCDRLGPWRSLIDYTLQLVATQTDADTATVLAQALIDAHG